jgi:PEP-CTERM motif
MLREKLRLIGIVVAPPAALTLMSAAPAMADYIHTFDSSGTVTNDTSGDSGQYGLDPSLGVINSRFDYGSGGPPGTHATGWSNAADFDVNGGGSLMQSITFKSSPTAQAGAFTVDISGVPILATDLSFNIMIAPGSADSGTAGASFAAGSSGYFQVAIRDGSYDFTNVPDVFVNGVDQGGNGWNFGDPTYSGTSDQGTWEHIDIPLNPSVSTENIRALTFQDYDDDSSTSRLIAGQVTWYIDDLNITGNVPEPATLGLLALGVPALMMRRRKKA